MISFIKSYTLENINRKLLLLYLLNVTDIIFTLLLLSSGYFIEANTLMVKAVDSLFSSFILKVVLPAALLSYVYFRMKNANEKQLRQSSILLNIANGFYVIINTSHLIYLLLFTLLKIFAFV